MPYLREVQVEQAKKEWSAKHADFWRRHRSLEKFLRDHTMVAKRVLECGKLTLAERCVERPDTYRIRPVKPCRIQPWCPRCVHYAAYRRAKDLLDNFRLCTPAGEKPRFIHIVQTAPYGRTPYKGGGDWGRQACQDIKAFREIVWDSLLEFVGPGIGGALTYQDFGEEGFAKRHPHIDLTLNGWRLGDDGPEHVPPIQITKKTRRQWDELVVSKATRLNIAAEKGSPEFQRPAVGVPAYWRALMYQLREMVDVTSLDYDRSRQIVWWTSKKHNKRTRIEVRQWKAGLQEYSERLQQFQCRRGARLTAKHGHMGQRVIRRTAAAMGGRLECPECCWCRECVSWQPVGSVWERDEFWGEGEGVRLQRGEVEAIGI